MVLSDFNKGSRILGLNTLQVIVARHGVVGITAAQLYSTKPELGVSEIYDGENL